MSDHSPSPSRPAAVASPASPVGRSSLLEQVIASTASGGGFDADAFHVMEKRDESLIASEVLNGSGSSKFVYEFSVSGKLVSGISVVGARHLAYHYGGIRHRLIAATEKSGSLFTFTTFPYEGTRMEVSCSTVRELESEPDFYTALIEITDIKTGNSIQVEKRELREERRQDGSYFARPHFQLIAQSKAFRNGVLAIIPQDIQLKWKLDQLRLDKKDVITSGVADEKRAGVLRYAAAQGVAVNRQSIEALTLDQITGLGDAARSGDKGAFLRSAVALGIVTVTDVVDGNAPASQAAQEPPKERKPRQARQEAPPPPVEPQREPEPAPPVEAAHDRETGELLVPPDDGPTQGEDDAKELDFK